MRLLSVPLRRVPCLLPWLLALCFAAGGAAAQDIPTPVADAFHRAGIPLSSVGIWVQPVGLPAEGARPPETPVAPSAATAGVPAAPLPALVAVNDGSLFSPASIMKLVTSGAALDILGPGYTWKTDVLATSQPQSGVLHGDLVFRGGGDPRFVQEHLWLFLRQLRERGIRDVQGDLILDDSLFADAAYDPAQFDGEPSRPYNAGPDALLLNYEAISLRFVPDAQAGMVHVQTDPPMAGFTVAAPALGSGPCGDWRTAVGAVFSDKGVDFTGHYPAACGEQAWALHPWQMSHAQYFGAVFRALWQELGGTLAGRVRNGLTPATAIPVATWQSAPLPEAVRDMNKYSNNVMARQLLLTLAAETGTRPASAAQGAQAISAWLAARGINAPGLLIENGSGLSRNERITPRTMGRMLAALFQGPVMPEFMASLPVVGVDGTMRKRLVNRAIAGNAHIKTGTLEGVRSIAGYVLSAWGHRYVVVCIVNDPRAALAQPAQDALLRWVYRLGTAEDALTESAADRTAPVRRLRVTENAAPAGH